MNHVRRGAGRYSGMVVFVAGSVSVVMQTLLVREVFAVTGGNELVIGLMFAVWLAATAAGSVCGQNCTRLSLQSVLFALLLSSAAGMVGIRAVRLLLLPGAVLPPHWLPVLLAVVEAPVAAGGGYIFGLLVRNRNGVPLYFREQTGNLCGLCLVSLAVWRTVPNFGIAAGILLVLTLVIRGKTGRGIAVVMLLFFFLSDSSTAAWKYPLPVRKIIYTPEGEVATAEIDGESLTYVNGRLQMLSYATPAVEQAVHGPLSMLPHSPRKVLLLNDAGHRTEAVKYRGATVDCIRLDRLPGAAGCPPGKLSRMRQASPYDAVILGCSLPDNAASSRYFTRSFFRSMKSLTGDSGIFSFTLPFQSEYSDEREEAMRSIIISTLRSVFHNVKVLPGEGFTFLASGADYPLPDTCRVATGYFQPVVLSALTPERIAAANRPPSVHLLHTAAHPRLLVPVLDGFLRMFSISRWMFIAVPLLLTLVLLPAIRMTKEMVSVGGSGMCTGLYSVGLVIMYQSIYGTVYSRLPLLLLALAVGFFGGCFIRRFPFSDFIIGGVLSGSLVLFVRYESPPAALFFIANAVAGFASAAQFVTRRTDLTARLYAADCTGGVLGMSLASTVIIPQFGLGTVAVGIAVIKIGTALVFPVGRLFRSRPAQVIVSKD